MSFGEDQVVIGQNQRLFIALDGRDRGDWTASEGARTMVASGFEFTAT